MYIWDTWLGTGMNDVLVVPARAQVGGAHSSKRSPPMYDCSSVHTIPRISLLQTVQDNSITGSFHQVANLEDFYRTIKEVHDNKTASCWLP